MNRPAIVIALVAAFLIGASLGLMGGVAFSLYSHRLPPHPEFAGGLPRGGPGMPPHALRAARMLPRLRAALELSDAQADAIRPLIEDAHQSMGATRDSLRARIERILTPEQRERWRRLEARHGFPGETRGPLGRAHRALPGPEGEDR